MKLRIMSLVTAAVLAIAAASINVHAQTVQLAMGGSSAMYQEMGQADFAQKGCIFINSTKGFNVVDSRGASPHAVSITDTAAAWVAWTTGGGSCSSPGAGSVVDFYMNLDSVLGNRCFFASPSCAVSTNGSFSATCGTALPGTSCTNLPASLQTAINNSGAGTRINAAGTDIRPEDAKFATIRALTPCNTSVGTGSQYIGLGMQTSTSDNQGFPFLGSVWVVNGFTMPGGSFNVGNFNLSGNDPASGSAIANGTGNGWAVIPVGAAPQLVFVNPSNTIGLGSLAVTNVNRATLSGFMDGTFGAVQDLFPQAFSGAGEVPVNVVLREPMSGTYNTFEYAIPNDVENQSSQEIGLAAIAAHTAGAAFPPYYCTGPTVTNASVSGPSWTSQVAPNNPLQESDGHANVTSTRSRGIGTGNVVKIVENVKDALGYAFWSQANFSSATPGNAKYITVDGIDPIQEVWQDGEVPTTSNGLLGNVSMSHVKDGSYPIWSLLRMVTSTSTTACNNGVAGTACNVLLGNLAASAQTFVTPAFPDFVIASGTNNQLLVTRSHFTPPTVVYPGNGGSPCNGDAGSSEAGGDVGGVVYSIQADNDYSGDSLSSCGNVAHRQ